MKVLLQVRFKGAQQAVEALEPHEQQAIAGEYITFRHAPEVLDGRRLEPAENATIVRVVNGAPVTAGGPLAGTLDGYHLCESPDLATAIALASQIPAARMGGTVEVRAVLES